MSKRIRPNGIEIPMAILVPVVRLDEAVFVGVAVTMDMVEEDEEVDNTTVVEGGDVTSGTPDIATGSNTPLSAHCCSQYASA